MGAVPQQEEEMNVIEAFSKGKRDVPQLCEDGYVVTNDFAAVVDGSTSKRSRSFRDTNDTGEINTARDAAIKASPIGGGREGAETPGHLAMRTVLAAIEALPAEADVATAVHTFTDALRSQWPAGSDRDAALRPTCSAVVFSRVRQEVWMIGDCQCRFNGATHTNPKLVDTILTRARSEAVHYLLSHGHTAASLRQHDLGRAIIYDALREQTNFQNSSDACNPYRYAVLDGMPVPLQLVRVLPIARAATIVLASDGYPVLADTLAESEAALARLLRDDPLCIDALAATKCLMHGNCSFDDRTFLKLAISSPR